MIKFINFLFFLLILNACDSKSCDTKNNSSDNQSNNNNNDIQPPPTDPDAIAKAAAAVKIAAAEREITKANTAKNNTKANTAKNNTKADETQLNLAINGVEDVITKISAASKKADIESEVKNLKSKLTKLDTALDAFVKAKAKLSADETVDNAKLIIADAENIAKDAKVDADKKKDLEDFVVEIKKTQSDLETEKNKPTADIENIKKLENKLSEKIEDLKTKKNTAAAELITPEQTQAKRSAQTVVDSAEKELNKAKDILNNVTLSDSNDLNNKQSALGEALFGFNKLSATASANDIKAAQKNIVNALNVLNQAKAAFEAAEEQAKKEVQDKAAAAKSVGTAPVSTAAPTVTIDPSEEQKITEAMNIIDWNKNKREAIAKLNLKSVDDFKKNLVDSTGKLNTDFLSTFIDNLEGATKEQKDYFLDTIGEKTDSYTLYFISVYLNKYGIKNIDEYKIYEYLKKEKKYENIDRNFSMKISDRLLANYKDAKNTLVLAVETLLTKNVLDLFASDFETDDDKKVLDTALSNINENVLIDYINNTSTKKDVTTLLSLNNIVSNYYSDRSYKVLSAIFTKFGKFTHLRNVFDNYLDNLNKVNKNNSKNDKEYKNTIIKTIELIMQNCKSNLVSKDNFHTLLQNINKDIFYEHLKYEKFILELQKQEDDPEVLQKLIDLIKAQASDSIIKNDNLPIMIDNYKKYKDNKNWAKEHNKWKQSIKILFANIDSLLIQKPNYIFSDDRNDQIDTLLMYILVTDDDRKEFYEFLDKQYSNYGVEKDNIYPYFSSLLIITNKVIDMLMANKTHTDFSNEDYTLLNKLIRTSQIKDIAIKKLDEWQKIFNDTAKRSNLSPKLKEEYKNKIDNAKTLNNFISNIAV